MLKQYRATAEQAASLEPLFVSEGALSKLDGLSRNTRRKLIADGKYPKPVAISDRRVGWRLSEIRAWAAALPTAATFAGGAS